MDKIHWQAHPGQQEFALAINGIRELLYGGARGGGKTQAGIAWMAEPSYIDNPHFRALVIRRNADDLSDWTDRAARMWEPIGAVFKGKPAMATFPSGAKIRTGHFRDDKAFSKYQGHEYQKMLIEELTQIPSELNYKSLLSSCRSTIPGLDARMFCTTNPGGVGHSWVKARWGLGKMGANKPNMAYRIGKTARYMMYIPATMDDNPTLMSLDPEYVAEIEELPEPLRSAWRYGDWDVFMGQLFAFNEVDHVIDPIPVPANAKMMMTFDWGFGAPYSVGWWWVDEDGRMYRFTELYGGMTGQPNVGLRQTDEEIGESIKAHEQRLGIKADKILRLCDPTCFNRKPDYKGGGQGPSTAEVFAKQGLTLTRGDPSRILKIRQFHQRLRVRRDENGNRTELPMMVIYNTCKDFIRTIPSLQADTHNVEDVDTTMEDHIYDEAALACMARPLGRQGTGAIMERGRA